MILGLFLGCGGAGGTSTFSSGVSPDKGLAGLSQEESEKVCTAERSWEEANVQFPQATKCRAVAWLATFEAKPGTDKAAEDTCKSAYEACLNKPPQTSDRPLICVKPPASCAATVGEYEVCVRTLPESARVYEASFPSCDNLTFHA
jgi:hypothetical protein